MQFSMTWRSFIKTVKSKGPKMEPCRTPFTISLHVDFAPPTTTPVPWDLPYFQAVIKHLSQVFAIPGAVILNSFAEMPSAPVAFLTFMFVRCRSTVSSSISVNLAFTGGISGSLTTPKTGLELPTQLWQLPEG